MTNLTKTFDCGCTFPVDNDGKIIFDPDVEKLNLECPKVWDMLTEGKTTGVFQLESKLGSSYAKKLKPKDLDGLSLLIAAIRPGCLEAKVNDKTVTQHLVDRYNGEAAVEYYHESLADILDTTLGLLVYQESALLIVQKLAGFNLSEADLLRRAIGKKKPEEMAKVKTKFLEGCKKLKLVNDNEAEEIFGMIEKSQRYSFNASHSYSYAMNAYLAAYVKTHFPHEFFTSALYYSKNKPKPMEEIKNLISDLRSFQIDVRPPSLKQLNKNFALIDNSIYFGLTNVKGIGNSVYNKIKKVSITTDRPWIELLIFELPKLTSTAVKAMIDVGCFNYLNIDRKRLKYEYEKYSLLSNREKNWIQQNYNNYQWDTLHECLKTVHVIPSGKDGACANQKRRQFIQDLMKQLQHSPYSLVDTPVYIAEMEESLLGVPITCTTIDECNISNQNCCCQEFQNGINLRMYWIPAQIDRKHEITTKNKKKMCFLTVSDISGTIDSVVVFPEQYKKFRTLLFDKNNIMLVGKNGKDKGSLIVDKIYQI